MTRCLKDFGSQFPVRPSESSIERLLDLSDERELPLVESDDGGFPRGNSKHCCRSPLLKQDYTILTPRSRRKVSETILWSPRGFTLVEILIAVTIVGILVAVVVPYYLQYQMRARQVEARLSLGGVYVSENAFFGENGFYGSFEQIGYVPAGSTNRYTYRSPATSSSTAAGGASTCTKGVDAFFTSTGPGAGTCLAPNGPVVATGSTLLAGATPAAFSASAIGNIDADATTDNWHVNDIKQNLQRPDSNDVST